MSVQYKTSDGWRNISTSSNNAIDTIENGNMSPITSNAVYDSLNNVTDVSMTQTNNVALAYNCRCFRLGKLILVILNLVAMELLVSYILGLLTLPVILALVCVWQAIFEDE